MQVDKIFIACRRINVGERCSRISNIECSLLKEVSDFFEMGKSYSNSNIQFQFKDGLYFFKIY